MHTLTTSEKGKSTTATPQRGKQQPFFAPVRVQPQLTIGAIDDPYEREADAMADRVMRMPAQKQTAEPTFFSPRPVITPGIQRECATCEEEKVRRKEEIRGEEPEALSSILSFDAGSDPGDGTIQRKCAACEEKERILKKDNGGGGGVAVAPSIVHDVVSSGGQRLDAGTRSFFEPRFGHDFSHVRIHTDSKAAESSDVINAHAYTLNNNIVFNQGKYAPGTDAGKRLLAHELTHVVQQGNNLSRLSIQRDASDAHEPTRQSTATRVEGILTDNYPFLKNAIPAEQYTKITNVFKKYIESIEILERNPGTMSVRERYQAIGTYYTPARGDYEYRVLQNKQYIERNAIQEIPSERLFDPADLQIDETLYPEYFGFKEYFIKYPVSIICRPEAGAGLYPDHALDYSWGGQILAPDQYIQGRLIRDNLIGRVAFINLPTNVLLTTGLDKIGTDSVEHFAGYAMALDNLDVVGMSIASEVITVDWLLIQQTEHELRKLYYVYPSMLNALARWEQIRNDFVAHLSTSFGLTLFKGNKVYPESGTNPVYDNPEIGIPRESVEAIQIVDSLNKLIDLLIHPITPTAFFSIGVSFLQGNGKPINMFFKRKVLQDVGLWDRLQMYCEAETNFSRYTQNAQLLGAYMDVGGFDLDKVSELLDTGYLDWWVSGAEAGKIFEMMIDATPAGREAILNKLLEKGLLIPFLGALPYQAVHNLADAIEDPFMKRLLASYYEGKGGGKSAAKMIDDEGVEQAGKGHYVRAYGLAFVHTAWNATSVGFLDTYSDAYDQNQMGLISDNDLVEVGTKATFRSAVVLTVSALTAGTATTMAEGAMLRVGMGEGGAALVGNITGGAVGGLSDQFTSDVVSIALLNQDGFSPGRNYLMAAGIGGGMGALTTGLTKWNASRMSGLYGESHPWMQKLFNRSGIVEEPTMLAGERNVAAGSMGEINSRADILAERPVTRNGETHESVLSRKGVGICSPFPCPLIDLTYARELAEVPEFAERYGYVKQMRDIGQIGDANEAAHDLTQDLIDYRQARQASASRGFSRESIEEHMRSESNDTSHGGSQLNEDHFGKSLGEDIDTGMSARSPEIEAARERLEANNRSGIEGETILRAKLNKLLQPGERIIEKPYVRLSNGSWTFPDFAIVDAQGNILRTVDAKTGNSPSTPGQKYLADNGGIIGGRRYPDLVGKPIRAGTHEPINITLP